MILKGRRQNLKIQVENWQDKYSVSKDLENLIENCIYQSLELQEFTKEIVINIILTDNKKIQDMNFEYRNIAKATDVLSFPMLEMQQGKFLNVPTEVDYDDGHLLLGDVVISLEKVDSQAIDYGHSFEREFSFLLTHGIFHLLGYDHLTDEEEAIMISKQEEVLKILNLGR